MRYVADFETTTEEQYKIDGKTRVWACGITEINDSYKHVKSDNIDFFFNFAMWNGGEYYFHNLKFDASFIICELFRRGYKHKQDKKNLKNRNFTTLISSEGQFYTMTIRFPNGVECDIIDSLKIFPMKVDQIAKSFKFSTQKLDLDYDKYRGVDHKLTDREKLYLEHDCKIVAQALNLMFSESAELEGVGDVKLGFAGKITQGSMALMDYKRIIGKKNFKRWFPIPKYDRAVRDSYKGGFTYCNSRFQLKDIGEGIVLDVNSLYPSVMYNCLLPYGEGVHFEGKYVEDNDYPLYVQGFTCHFEIKPNKIPMLQVKGGNSPFIETEYLLNNDGHDVTLVMTNVDLKLFMEHYDVNILEWHEGYKFKGTKNLFKDYIDKWYEVKVQAEKHKNYGLRTIAKLMMNALYGKFALNPKVKSKYPYDSDGVLKYFMGEEEERKPIYIPIGSFITSYARDITIRSGQKVYPRFLYADTDSLHLMGKEIPKELWVDEHELGAWKIEGWFERARYIRQKCYVEEMIVSEDEYNDAIRQEGDTKQYYIRNGKMCKLNITVAGMPTACYKHVTWDNFIPGSSFEGKLKPIQVEGGMMLSPTEFTIIENGLDMSKLEFTNV